MPDTASAFIAGMCLTTTVWAGFILPRPAKVTAIVNFVFGVLNLLAAIY